MADLDRLTGLLRTLADETRLRIVHLLWRTQPRQWAVGELVEVLDRPQPTVSRHLGQLRAEGLVTCVTRGSARLYGLPATQPPDHAALLGALEPLVPTTPEAHRDLERALEVAPASTSAVNDATQTLHDERDEGDAAMTAVLHALSHPTRRRLLDDVGRRPGTTLGQVAKGHPLSRAAIGKHLATLERAGLVLSRREGRRRRLYPNPLPIQLVYDRWTTRFSAPLARHVAAIKYAVEDRDD